MTWAKNRPFTLPGLCALERALRKSKPALAALDRVTRIVRVEGYVQSADGFFQAATSHQRRVGIAGPGVWRCRESNTPHRCRSQRIAAERRCGTRDLGRNRRLIFQRERTMKILNCDGRYTAVGW